MARISKEVEFLKEREMVWKQRSGSREMLHPLPLGVRNKWLLFERHTEEVWESKALACTGKWTRHSERS